MQWNTATSGGTARALHAGTTRAGVALLLAAGLSGCLTVDDDEGPIMSIELFWDARPTSSAFLEGDCRDADVRWMEWTLYRTDTDDEIATRSEPCADGIDVIDPKPGEYWLEITGFDEEDNAIWQASCPENPDNTLTVLRFDVAYACDIPAPP